MLDPSIVKTELEQKLRELQDRAAEIEDSLSAPKDADSEERAGRLPAKPSKKACEKYDRNSCF